MPIEGLKTLWPTDWIKENGFYFYNIPITKYYSSTEVEVEGHGRMTMFGGYSYLSLHGDPRIKAAALAAADRYGTGGHGVRLLAGTTNLHQQLEHRIAEFKHAEEALTFSSGYIANISVISALATRHDTILADQLVHASLIDACMLSRARLRRFAHNDIDQLEAMLKKPRKGRTIVIADSVFSMDGDIFDLPKAIWLCKKYDAIMVLDECHATGVIGKTGRGIEEHFGLRPGSVDIKTGTMGKTIPSQGGFVTGNKELVHFLRHQGRGFIYSGANTPMNDATSIAALEIMMNEPERVTRLHQNVDYARAGLEEANVPLIEASSTAIMPILCGSEFVAFQMAKACQDNGIYIQAIPSPVVPKGQARLRLAINADHTKEQIDHMVGVLKQATHDIITGPAAARYQQQLKRRIGEPA